MSGCRGYDLVSTFNFKRLAGFQRFPGGLGRQKGLPDLIDAASAAAGSLSTTASSRMSSRMFHADMATANNKNAVGFHSHFPLSLSIFARGIFLSYYHVPWKTARAGSYEHRNVITRFYPVSEQKYRNSFNCLTFENSSAMIIANFERKELSFMLNNKFGYLRNRSFAPLVSSLA